MQFTLSKTLTAVALISVFLAVMWAMPTPVAGFVILAFGLLAPAPVIAGIVYGKRETRAFFVGVAVGVTPLAVSSIVIAALVGVEPFHDDVLSSLAAFANHLGRLEPNWKILFASTVFGSLAGGAAAMFMRSWLLDLDCDTSELPQDAASTTEPKTKVNSTVVIGDDNSHATAKEPVGEQIGAWSVNQQPMSETRE